MSSLRNVVYKKLKENNNLALWPICRTELLSLESQGYDDIYLEAYKNNEKCENTANSTIAYVLGICPKPDGDMKLISNPELADIDSDFDREKREDIITVMTDWFGDEYVARIGAYQTVKIKSAIRIVLKYFGLTEEQIVKLVGIVPNDCKDLSEAMDASEALAQRFKTHPDERQLVSTIVNAMPLSAITMHPAGIVIGSKPIHEIVPFNRCNKGEVTAVDMNDVASMGLVKFDFLGLSNITMVSKCLDYIKKRHGVDIDLTEIDLSDKKCLEMFDYGETASVFQFETNAFLKVLKETQVDSFDDLTAIVAINRPGGKKYISKTYYDRFRRKVSDHDVEADPEESPIGTYKDNKENPNNIHKIHPVVDEILMSTYGIPIFQEQAMEIAQRLTKWSAVEADHLRRAVGKKDDSLFEECRKNFYIDASNNGIDKKVINRVWGIFRQFGGYAFNRSHAASYALLAFWNMWLKEYYTTEWFAAVMETEFSDTAGKQRMREHLTEWKMIDGRYTSKLEWYVDRAKVNGSGCYIQPPCITKSDIFKCIIEHNNVILPLCSIPGVGSNAAGIIDIRDDKAFVDFTDFVFRSNMTASIIEKMIDHGALDCFTQNTNRVLLKEQLVYVIEERQERRKSERQRGRKTVATVDEDSVQSIFGNIKFQPGIKMLDNIK